MTKWKIATWDSTIVKRKSEEDTLWNWWIDCIWTCGCKTNICWTVWMYAWDWIEAVACFIWWLMLTITKRTSKPNSTCDEWMSYLKSATTLVKLSPKPRPSIRSVEWKWKPLPLLQDSDLKSKITFFKDSSQNDCLQGSSVMKPSTDSLPQIPSSFNTTMFPKSKWLGTTKKLSAPDLSNLTLPKRVTCGLTCHCSKPRNS
mgnify:CR=1 FL=1